MSEILPLTSLRFIAAFYVFIFHIHIRWPLTNHHFLNKFFLEGAVGMSLFFILSGFILYYRYHQIEFTPKRVGNYVLHRFSRIYPIYLLAAISTLPWIGISFEEVGISATLLYIGRLLFIIFTNIFLLQAWFPQLFDYWNNGGSWSISVEAFFYTLFPFIQNLINKFQLKQILLVGFIAYIFTILFGISYILFPKDYAIRLVYSMPIFRLPEFIIGIVAAVISVKYHNHKINYPLIFYFSTFIIIFYLAFCGKTNSGYLVHNFIIVPLITLIIYSAAHCKSGLVYKLLSLKPLVILGHASYSFYSLQALLVLYIAPNYNKIVGNLPFWSKSSVFLFILFCCLSLMSLLSYYLIEEPVRLFLNKKLANKIKL